MMLEEIDYSEEAKHDLFESTKESSADWSVCIVSGTKPSYEDARRRATKMGKSLTKRQYEKACGDLGFK